MIAVNELRIGNWVTYMGDRFGTIQYLKDVVYITGNTQWSYKSITPIPISSDILEKAGFEKIQEGSMSHPEVWRISYQRRVVENKIDISIRGEEEIYWLEGNTIVELHFVHQLMNLYFALTGKELDIKL